MTRPVFAWTAVASAVMSEKPQRALGLPDQVVVQAAEQLVGVVAADDGEHAPNTGVRKRPVQLGDALFDG